MQFSRLSLCPLWLAGALTTVSAVQAAPITFNTALPVAEDEFVLRLQAVRIQSGHDPGAENRDISVTSGVGVLGYGVTPKLAVFGALPFVNKDMDLEVNGQRRNRSTKGVGDVSLFGRYTVYQQDRPGQTFRIAPFAGVKVPTGDDEESDALGRLPQPFQLGSGSWDLFGGVVATYQTLGSQMDTQLSYRVNTEANDFDTGDEARWDASLQVRLWPRTLTGEVSGFLYGVLESNVIYREKNQLGGHDDPNSGGFTWLLAPGVQYVTKRWIVETVVQLPVVQDLHDNALENEFTARVGVRMNF